jgi:hypothetical protein
MKKKLDENIRKFSDFSNKSWLVDGDTIKIADSVQMIIKGEGETLEVKEILHGNPYQTFKMVFTANGGIYLLKTSRELK